MVAEYTLRDEDSSFEMDAFDTFRLPTSTTEPRNETQPQPSNANTSATHGGAKLSALSESQQLLKMSTSEVLKSSESLSFRGDGEPGDESLNRFENPYNVFLQRLKDPECIQIVQAVKGLIAMLPGDRQRSEVAPIVHNFIDTYTPKLLQVPIFASLSDDQRLFSAEAFEKFTLQKLYPLCYRMDPNDPIEDELLWIKIKALEWVEPMHLEISDFGRDETLIEAQEHLQKLSKYKAPRDKLISILNACRLIVHALEQSSNKPASADDTFPLLIYTIIRANPPELHSNIEFVHFFRHPSKHVAEEAYAFTLLVSAVEYIKAVGKGTSFKMDPQEFVEKFSQGLHPNEKRWAELEALSVRSASSGASIPGHLSGVALQQALLDGFKRLTPPGHFWKHLFTPRRTQAVQALESLEALLRDVDLMFDPMDTKGPDTVALLSDWRVLTAMRLDAIKQVAELRTKL